MQMMMTANQHIKKLLESSPNYYNEKGLNPSQIKWRTSNSRCVLGLLGKVGLFGKIKQLILVEKADESGYMLLCPAEKKDAYPRFLYDIMDIEEFTKKFPVRAFVFGDDRDIDMDILYDNLEDIKDKMTKGFIDIKNNEVFVYELTVL